MLHYHPLPTCQPKLNYKTLLIISGIYKLIFPFFKTSFNFSIGIQSDGFLVKKYVAANTSV